MLELSTSNASRLFDLTGRVAIVTGAGRGLGRTLALGLAQAGADVAAVGRTPDPLDSLAQEIAALGRTGSTHPTDVTEHDAVRRMVDDVVARHGRVDILVNNAGTKVPQEVLDVTEQAWNDIVATNLTGAFFVAQAVGRRLVDQGHGKIVNVASTYSVVAAPGRAAYAATKGGLMQLTRVMAVEWAGRGVNVNAVGPTSIPTPMNDALFADPQWREAALAKIPAGRFCEPEDVVGAVVFLASDAAVMVHGQLLLIDGGLTVA